MRRKKEMEKDKVLMEDINHPEIVSKTEISKTAKYFDEIHLIQI